MTPLDVRPRSTPARSAATPAPDLHEEAAGAALVVAALRAHGVEVIFGYPGGAVLPIYDALLAEAGLTHVLVRHEQAAVHAAEGYARATGKVGVALVTSGPGATNAVTGLTDALMDSIPLVVLSGQVPTHLVGTDAFQECDTVGITRSCTKMNWLVRDTDDLQLRLCQAFEVAASGRPGPVLVDIPKDVQIATGPVRPAPAVAAPQYRPRRDPDPAAVLRLVEAIETAERPVLYTGGGVINAGPEASRHLRALADATGIPVTSTLMGLGAYPASGPNWLGMLGMHGLYEANMAMHDCDLMINVGARFDDRVTGRVGDFSPHARKAHIDIDAASINKVIPVEIPILADAGPALEAVLDTWRARGGHVNRAALARWHDTIAEWRAVDCLAHAPSGDVLKPQEALARLDAQTRHLDRYVCTEVGQHQMWAAQFMHFDAPNRWMTSGGLGTMGYGFPASLGVQMAHPEALVINVAGEASWLMNMQETGTAVQYGLSVKQFILNNERLGMVRQWQDLLHGQRYAHSWSEALPDFVRLAEACGWKGIRVTDPSELDAAIAEMIAHPGPVLVDCLVEKHENCLPMIPSGAPHNQMILPPEARLPRGQEAAPGSGGAALV